MPKWTQSSVERKLQQSAGFDSFVTLKRGYLPIRIAKTDLFIFREEIGVSYFFRYPIMSIEDVKEVNEFMFYAFPYLTNELRKAETKYLLL